ncbi:hypothetical protein [Brevundimonas sp.]|uniref:hypothetical protein n=1 Tax=Brevundimonas sp. TaxID=1871086 RepID=UPI00391BDEB9
MKRFLMMAAVAAFAAAPAYGQDAPSGGAETSLSLPLVEGVSAAPDCGGLYGLEGRAQCMSTRLSQLPAVAELYMAALPQAGWAHVDGGDNQVLFQNVRPDSQCDFLIMLAFYDDTLPEEALADATGYLGFVLRTQGACIPAQTEEETAPQ